ncbi:MAG: phage GP46 family protein [Deltaproteobacteria bacterium]|nr:phage GP46 family protein [Deltaproteobacteria bacterium]
MDLKLTWNAEKMLADISLAGADLATDEGLETAVLISLFTDRRAEDDDDLPGDPQDKRGWWADAFQEDKIGSRLWLLSRAKSTTEVLIKAREYAEEALAWMIADGVARAVKATAEKSEDMLALKVEIHRPDGKAQQYRFEAFWEGA